MSSEESRANTRIALEETAKAFGISVEQAAKIISDELQLREARRAGAPEWVIDAARATPTSLLLDIALRDNRAPTGPSSQGVIPSSQQVSNVRTGGGSGHVVPLGPPPGINHVDAIVEADTARQRADAIIEEGKRRAALGKR
jgi:hypothetical protein